ncbi:MAG: SHOCT domain-containing protein [Geobacteraceae bacterium]|nr:SHOCT domain-containing protein [Geobacteraceae bacterium]
MNMYQGTRAVRLFSVAAIVVSLSFAVVAQAAGSRQLWHSREQFVALEPLEKPSSGSMQTNDHPVELTLEKLTAILESIDIRASAGGKPEALFTKATVEVIVPELLNGLRLATPTEDVTFAVIGLHSALYGLAKSPRVTTGRVFYKDGRLSIIFGLVQQEVRDRDDRRLFPFTPGSRSAVAPGDWTLLPQTGRSGFSLVRKDWVTFSDEWLAPVAPAPVVEQKTPPVPAAAAQPVKTASEPRNPSERLTILNELKNKGLITEDEFRTKRLEILNGI